MFGTQPQQWRKAGRLDRRQLMASLTLAHLQHLHQRESLKPVLLEKPAFHLAGLMTLVQDDPAIVRQLWNFLEQQLETLASVGDRYGLTWYPPDWEKSGCFYLAAVEVPSPDAAGLNLVVKTVPAMTYASFIHCGGRAKLNLTLDYIYQTWLPQSGRRLACPLEIEHHLDRELAEFDDTQSQWKIYVPIE
jgi:AraC family transcriptional regulator